MSYNNVLFTSFTISPPASPPLRRRMGVFVYDTGCAGGSDGYRELVHRSNPNAGA